MPGNQVFIADADLYNRLGGQAALTQLLDPQGTGTWNPAVSLLARTDACNIVLEAAGVQVDLGGYLPSDFSLKFPTYVTYAAWKAIALAWDYGTGGQAMPDRIAGYDARADAALELLARRRLKHGASDFSPNPSQATSGGIDIDPHHTRTTLHSWHGFA